PLPFELWRSRPLGKRLAFSRWVPLVRYPHAMARLTLFPELIEDPPAQTTGLLPSQRIRDLLAAGHVTAPIPVTEEQIQPASLDLRLGPVAHRVRASFLPSTNMPASKRIEQLKMHDLDLTSPCILERDCVYIIPTLEEVSLPEKVSSRANPKSTVGRLDVLTRLNTEYGPQFDR